MWNVGPSPWHIVFLAALQRKRPGEIYAGTVPAKEKARRRAANRRASASRRVNR